MTLKNTIYIILLCSQGLLSGCESGKSEGMNPPEQTDMTASGDATSVTDMGADGAVQRCQPGDA